MMKFNLFLLAVFAFNAWNNAYAGNEKGNGGSGFSCKDVITGQIKSVHLLDLFEGSLALYPRRVGYQYPLIPTTVDAEIARALTRASVNPTYETELAQTISFLNNSRVMLPNQVVLEPTDDIGSEVGMRGCDFVQIANYIVDDGIHSRLDIDAELFSKMDATNQAALLVHEAVYALSRKYVQDIDSKRSRKITAMLMATDKLDVEIGAALGEVIPDHMDLARSLELIKGCKGASVLQIDVSIQGEAKLQGITVETKGKPTSWWDDINGRVLPRSLEVSSDGPMKIGSLRIACQDFKWLKWRTLGDFQSDNGYLFNIKMSLNGTMVFEKIQRSSRYSENGCFRVDGGAGVCN